MKLTNSKIDLLLRAVTCAGFSKVKAARSGRRPWCWSAVVSCLGGDLRDYAPVRATMIRFVAAMDASRAARSTPVCPPEMMFLRSMAPLVGKRRECHFSFGILV